MKINTVFRIIPSSTHSSVIMSIISAPPQPIAIPTEMAPLTTLIAPHIRIHAWSIATPSSRPCPATPDPTVTNDPTIHLLDRILRITLVLVDNERKTGRILSQPELTILAELVEGSLQLLLATVNAQVCNMDTVAVLFFVVGIICLSSYSATTA